MSERRKRKFLVDYDLPENAEGRKQFYQKLRNPELRVKKSTKSVIITDSLKSAQIIHEKVRSRGGRSHIYKVKKISKK